MFTFAGYTFLCLYRKRNLRLLVLPLILIPLIYHLGFQGFARYVIPIDALSHPAGLANFLASILAAWFGAVMFHHDKLLRNIDLMMTKPISTREFIAGKCLGTLALMGLIWTVVCFCLILAGLFSGGPVTLNYIFVLLYAFIGQTLIFFLAFVLSLKIHPLMAGILAVILNDRVFYSFVVNIDQLEGPGSLKAIAHWLASALYYAVPQVSEFALWGTAGYVYILDPVRVLFSTFYAVVFVMLLFFVAVYFFEKMSWNQP